MPIYEYRCDSCDELSEVMQRISDPPLDTCSACDGPLKKLISAPAFQFKGTGWYVTDYAKKSGDGADGTSAKSSEGDGKKDAGSKDTGSKDTATSDTGSSSSGESSTKSKSSPASA